MNKIFSPTKVGAISINNRIIMAPLTRCRTDKNRVPTPLMAKYYGQRASAGLIISEAVCISPSAVGYPDTPGIWSDEQIKAWKKVNDEIHKDGGKIVCQLWHVGRISHSELLAGKAPVAASAVKPKGNVNLLRPVREFETPQALDINQINEILAAYKRAAINAKLAGFDGVELHGANGYLPDQFLADNTNLREDEYGGKNKSRFLLEALDELIKVWGSEFVGLHISPQGLSNDIRYDNPTETFGNLAIELNKRKTAFVFVREPMDKSISIKPLLPLIRKNYNGLIMVNDGYDFTNAEKVVNQNLADAVSFGRAYISNPDLVARFQNNKALNNLDSEKLYGVFLEDKALGYTDYPILK